MQYDVVALAPENARDVHALETACFPQPWSEEQLLRGMAQGSLMVYGVFRGGLLSGYLSAYRVGDEAEIINLAVRGEFRRQGMGRAILVTVLKKWCDMGIKEGYLEVRATNAAAIALYSSCGFVPVGRRPRYYPDTGEDAILMRLTLQGRPSQPRSL